MLKLRLSPLWLKLPVAKQVFWSSLFLITYEYIIVIPKTGETLCENMNLYCSVQLWVSGDTEVSKTKIIPEIGLVQNIVIHGYTSFQENITMQKQQNNYKIQSAFSCIYT